MRHQRIFVNVLKKLVGLQLITVLMFSTQLLADWDKARAFADQGDYKQAFEEYLTLAESGHVGAQSMVGVMYYNGEGVTQDYHAALVWLNLAANQGYSVAQFNLGAMYDNGEGVEQDFSEAFNWYQQAASLGHSAAQFNLGAMYSNGEGTTEDRVRAHMWFNIAALNGNEVAADNRDLLEQSMTADEIATAVQMVGKCVASKYQGC